MLQDIDKGKVHNNLIRKWTLSTKRVRYYKRSDFKDYINCLRVTFQGHDGTTGDPNFKSYIYVYKSIQKRLFANFFKNNQKPGYLCFILIITKNKIKNSQLATCSHRLPFI